MTDPFADESGAHDYRALAERKDLLVVRDRAARRRPPGGRRRSSARSTSRPTRRDTDLWVKLFDVAPDGTAFNLMSPGLDVLRASYRDGGPEPEAAASPGQVYALRFENLMTGNLFAKGHRLRLVVSAAFFPHFSRNLHTGELETESGRAQGRGSRSTTTGRIPRPWSCPWFPEGGRPDEGSLAVLLVPAAAGLLLALAPLAKGRRTEPRSPGSRPTGRGTSGPWSRGLEAALSAARPRRVSRAS